MKARANLRDAVIDTLLAYTSLSEAPSRLETLATTLELEPDGQVIFCSGSVCGSVPKQVFGKPFTDEKYRDMYMNQTFMLNRITRKISHASDEHMEMAKSLKMTPSIVLNDILLPPEKKRIKMKHANHTNMLIEVLRYVIDSEPRPLLELCRLYTTEFNDGFLVPEAEASLLRSPLLQQDSERTPEWDLRYSINDNRRFLHAHSTYEGKRILITIGDKPQYVLTDAICKLGNIMFKDLVAGGLCIEDTHDPH